MFIEVSLSTKQFAIDDHIKHAGEASLDAVFEILLL